MVGKKNIAWYSSTIISLNYGTSIKENNLENNKTISNEQHGVILLHKLNALLPPNYNISRQRESSKRNILDFGMAHDTILKKKQKTLILNLTLIS